MVSCDHVAEARGSFVALVCFTDMIHWTGTFFSYLPIQDLNRRARPMFLSRKLLALAFTTTLLAGCLTAKSAIEESRGWLVIEGGSYPFRQPNER
jgi:hypothetical protein